MTLALTLAGIGALVVVLVLISRRLDPIGEDVLPDRAPLPVTPGDVPDAWIGWGRDDSRTTPLPHPTPVATGWRARMSRHVASRHERGSDVAHAESPDGEPIEPVEGDGSARVVELAPGVHASRQSMDEWIRERIGRAPYTRALLAQGAAREYRCSLRTAQRAVTRIISERSTK